MIIAIDIGNTNIDFGFFDDEDRFLFHEKLPTARVESMLSWYERLKESMVVSSVELVLMASVRPQIDEAMSGMMKKAFRIAPKKAGIDFRVPIRAVVDEPERVGIDRLIDAWEAWSRAKRETLTVNFGTAMVFNAVSATGDFLGGAIAPGLRTQAAGLHEHCVQLPMVDPAPYVDPIGRNTVHAMSVGLFHGMVGAAKHILRQMSERLGGSPRVFATGGDASRFAPFLPEIHEVAPHLTLEGLLHAFRAGSRK